MPDTARDRNPAASDAPACRRRWPPGVLGTLAYFTDHVLFRFDAPVDWLAARLADDFGYALPSCAERHLAALEHQELELFRCLARGMPHPVLADRFGLAEEAVSHAIAALENKLGLRGTDEFASLATRHGLL